MELDKEEILNELMNFEKNYGRDCENGLPDYLERLLINIAKSGDTIYPWNKIKPVILKKIELVVNEFNTKYPYENNPVLPNVKPFNFQEMKDEIIEKFDYFNGAPFTIQRICELLTAPYKYYKRSDKFMRGLEKNIRVISTIEARRVDSENEPESFQREFSRSPHNNSSSPSSSASSSNVLLSSSPLPSSSSSSLPSLSPSSSSTPSASASSQISSIASSSTSSSAFMNGLNEKEESSSRAVLCSNQMSQSCSHLQDSDPLPNSPAPLQQLDSFTTVFASPPSTPLAVVSDIHPYDAGSPSSSSSSSSESSPQPSSSSSPPPSLTPETPELNQSIDVELEDAKSQENSDVNKSGNLNGSIKPDDEQVNIMEQEEPMSQVEDDKSHDNLEEKLDVEQVEKIEEKQNENQDKDHEEIQNDQLTSKQQEKQDEKQFQKSDEKKDEEKGEKVEYKQDDKQDDRLGDKQDDQPSDKHDEMQDDIPEQMQEEMQEMQEEMHEEIQDKSKM